MSTRALVATKTTLSHLNHSDGGDDGTPVIQNEYSGDESQLFSINYYQKQAVIYSEMWPDCCLSVEEGGEYTCYICSVVIYDIIVKIHAAKCHLETHKITQFD